MHEITLTLTPTEFSTLWGCLMEQPAKHTFALLNKVQLQVNAQERAALSNAQAGDPSADHKQL